MSEKWPKQGNIERYVRSVFVVNFPMQYNELFSVSCQRVYEAGQTTLAYRTLGNPSGRILIFCNAGKQMPETLVVIFRVFNSRIFSQYKQYYLFIFN